MAKHSAESVQIHGITIVKDDIVRIKFRKLEDVLRDERQQARVNEILDFYKIDDHMNTFLQGVGHFKVTETNDREGLLRLHKNRDRSRSNTAPLSPKERPLPEITIINHNNDCYWQLNEILIEEIVVENDIADSYFSEDHQLSLVVVNSTMFINGKPVTATHSKIYQMFEKVMAEAAINSVLNGANHLDDEDDDF